MVNYYYLLRYCVIDSRGCDESIFVTLCTQVSGPPWPLPSGPFSFSNKPLPFHPLHSVIGSLTSLCLAHPTGSDQSNQSTAHSIITQLALTFSSPQTTRFQSQPAHSSILTHIHTEKPQVPSTQVHQVSVELPAPTTSLVYQWTQCSFLPFAAPHYMLVVLRSSFFEMASHTDNSSGFSGGRTGSFHLLVVDKPSYKTPVRRRP